MARLIQVDAFTSHAFGGNPAAVCLLDEPADPGWMQQVAAEMNLSETAFIEPGSPRPLRWFTPTAEVDLCGHATLATAHALWSEGIETRQVPLRFSTRSGVLTATAQAGWIELDLPAAPPTPTTLDSAVLDALGVKPTAMASSTFDLLELATPAEVEEATPDLQRLAQWRRGFILTARQAESVVCRVFAPGFGIPEDPVTGSAQCVLGPWWAPRLNDAEFTVHQVSKRRGELRVRVEDDRVAVAGQAVTVLRGDILS